MQVKLYSAPCSLVAFQALSNPTFRFVGLDAMKYQMASAAFGFQINFGRDYPIEFLEDDDKFLMYIPIGVETPFSERLKELWPQADPKSIVLRSAGYGRAFRLDVVGLDGFIKGEVASIAELYAMLEDRVGKSITRNMNLLQFPKDMDESTFMDYVTEETPYQNENVQYIQDNRYQIAAFESVKRGQVVKGYNKKTKAVEFLTDYEPSLSFELFYDYCTPAKDEHILAIAEDYYHNGVPEVYKHLEKAVSLDNFNIWALEHGKTYQAEVTSRIDAKTSFGDVLNFRVEPDEFDGVGLIFTLKNGEEFRMDDIYMREYYNAPLILLGEARQTAIEAGSPIRNLLDQKHGLRESI